MVTSDESTTGDGPSDKKGNPKRPRAEYFDYEIIEEYTAKDPSGCKSSASVTHKKSDLKKTISTKNSSSTPKPNPGTHPNVSTKLKSTKKDVRNVPKRFHLISRRPADVSDTLVSRCSYGNIMTPSMTRIDEYQSAYPRRKHVPENQCPTHRGDSRFVAKEIGFSSDENFSDIGYSSTAVRERPDSDISCPEQFERCVMKTTPRWNSNIRTGNRKGASDVRLGCRRNSIVFNRPVFTRINMFDMRAHDLFKVLYPGGLPNY